MTLLSLTHVQTNRDGVLSRRTFLRSVSAGAAIGALGWKDALSLHAQELQQRGLACILLFMNGGPSQFETFDPKPGHANGGPTKAIDTAISGVQLAEHWTNLAAQMQNIALIRSMTNKEGAHPRAVYQLHTGYIPSGGVKFPSFGAVAAKELAPPDFDLPHFVSVGQRDNIGAGFLGMQFAPFTVLNPNQMPSNVELPGGMTAQRFHRRLGLLKDLEKDFADAGAKHQ